MSVRARPAGHAPGSDDDHRDLYEAGARRKRWSSSLSGECVLRVGPYLYRRSRGGAGCDRGCRRGGSFRIGVIVVIGQVERKLAAALRLIRLGGRSLGHAGVVRRWVASSARSRTMPGALADLAGDGEGRGVGAGVAVVAAVTVVGARLAAGMLGGLDERPAQIRRALLGEVAAATLVGRLADDGVKAGGADDLAGAAEPVGDADLRRGWCTRGSDRSRRSAAAPQPAGRSWPGGAGRSAGSDRSGASVADDAEHRVDLGACGRMQAGAGRQSSAALSGQQRSARAHPPCARAATCRRCAQRVVASVSALRNRVWSRSRWMSSGGSQCAGSSSSRASSTSQRASRRLVGACACRSARSPARGR